MGVKVDVTIEATFECDNEGCGDVDTFTGSDFLETQAEAIKAGWIVSPSLSAFCSQHCVQLHNMKRNSSAEGRST